MGNGGMENVKWESDNCLPLTVNYQLITDDCLLITDN